MPDFATFAFNKTCNHVEKQQPLCELRKKSQHAMQSMWFRAVLQSRLLQGRMEEAQENLCPKKSPQKRGLTGLWPIAAAR